MKNNPSIHQTLKMIKFQTMNPQFMLNPLILMKVLLKMKKITKKKIIKTEKGKQGFKFRMTRARKNWKLTRSQKNSQKFTREFLRQEYTCKVEKFYSDFVPFWINFYFYYSHILTLHPSKVKKNYLGYYQKKKQIQPNPKNLLADLKIYSESGSRIPRFFLPW